jgi:hypothetical protein
VTTRTTNFKAAPAYGCFLVAQSRDFVGKLLENTFSHGKSKPVFALCSECPTVL